MSIAAMYLNLTGITGESLADKHVGDIDVVSWSWGMQASHYLSGGAPSGAAQFNFLTVVKRVDRATTALLSYLDGHTIADSATLSVSKAGGGGGGSLPMLKYFDIEMTNVRIVTIDLRTEDAEMLETVTLSAETITVNYTPQAAGGDLASAPVTFQATHAAS
jgi:type VI secretion system secreted protein Hcp